ncbi:uncharacterized protein H6S33_010628 [Morchella sextelata]|uniref:uncharacterized protein n=1 Tax=Morchella sextelata TaxID=1174677 RepID=UPI001D05854F|nr:uncharacterized protein H6S33_010628 [Morchella sextelata]KAH0611363.1 hypothetical protein H6S33_010628 [Morchella sextelata]
MGRRRILTSSLETYRTSRTLCAVAVAAALSTSRSTLAPAVPTPPLRPGSADNWSEKAKRRKTTGTGRMRYLKTVNRKFSNGFQQGAPKGARGPIANTVTVE